MTITVRLYGTNVAGLTAIYYAAPTEVPGSVRYPEVPAGQPAHRGHQIYLQIFFQPGCQSSSGTVGQVLLHLFEILKQRIDIGKTRIDHPFNKCSIVIILQVKSFGRRNGRMPAGILPGKHIQVAVFVQLFHDTTGELILNHNLRVNATPIIHHPAIAGIKSLFE